MRKLSILPHFSSAVRKLCRWLGLNRDSNGDTEQGKQSSERAFLTRRDALKILGICSLATAAVWMGIQKTISQTKNAGRRIIPKGTDPNSLVNADPENLDTSNLEPMPLQEFGTMGATDVHIEPGDWHFEVTGNVERELMFTYKEILELPAIERDVLLICPGFFANHGLWKGVAIQEFIKRSRPSKDVNRVLVYSSGTSRNDSRTERFDIEQAANTIFLAYKVNGKQLPRKHGFPLRLVARDHPGYKWIKYVQGLEFV